MKPKELLAVTFGTFVLIVLGDGVVANVVLGPRLAGAVASYNWNTIAFGWAFAVAASGLISGADNNPAVTLAMAVRGVTPWSKLLPIILAEFVGAFLGAFAVYLAYREGLVAAGLPNIYTTGPGAFYGPDGASAGQYSILTASITEFLGTTILMWGVLATSDRRNSAMSKAGPFVVGGIILVIGLCLGGPSGYSLNPARDLGPRLFGLISGTQGLFDGLYWLIPPVLIPFISAPIAGYLYDLFFASEAQPEALKAAPLKSGAAD
ncbi:MAG: aquaporin family protein [Chloroflexi bacterium]|nr:aquaporin [Anaerolineaceae bacterium]NMB89798.1 aquaporin family protein [Chloroflexota bacterium]